MPRTPGLIIPSAYPSQEALEADLRRRDEKAGFTAFDPDEFLDDIVHDFLEHYGVKGMRWGKRNVRPDEAARKARFGPKAKKIALGTAAVAGAAAMAYLASQHGGVKVSSLGGLTDRNSPLYQATVAGKNAANYTMSTAARTTKVVNIPNAQKALAANPKLKALTAGAVKAASSSSSRSLKDLGNLDNVRKQLDDPDFVWEF